jgi:hypothetical protein
MRSNVVLRGEGPTRTVLDFGHLRGHTGSRFEFSNRFAAIEFGEGCSGAGVENLGMDFSLDDTSSNPTDSIFDEGGRITNLNEFKNEQTSAFVTAVVFDESSKNNFISGCNIYRSGSCPVVLMGRNNTIENCEIDRSWNKDERNGEVVVGGTDNLVQDSTIKRIRGVRVVGNASFNVFSNCKIYSAVEFEHGLRYTFESSQTADSFLLPKNNTLEGSTVFPRAEFFISPSTVRNQETSVGIVPSDAVSLNVADTLVARSVFIEHKDSISGVSLSVASSELTWFQLESTGITDEFFIRGPHLAVTTHASRRITGDVSRVYASLNEARLAGPAFPGTGGVTFAPEARISGTATIAVGTNVVVGVGSSFLSDVVAGNTLDLNGTNFVISQVESDTKLVVATTASSEISASIVRVSRYELRGGSTLALAGNNEESYVFQAKGMFLTLSGSSIVMSDTSSNASKWKRGARALGGNNLFTNCEMKTPLSSIDARAPTFTESFKAAAGNDLLFNCSIDHRAGGTWPGLVDQNVYTSTDIVLVGTDGFPYVSSATEYTVPTSGRVYNPILRPSLVLTRLGQVTGSSDLIRSQHDIGRIFLSWRGGSSSGTTASATEQKLVLQKSSAPQSVATPILFTLDGMEVVHSGRYSATLCFSLEASTVTSNPSASNCAYELRVQTRFATDTKLKLFPPDDVGSITWKPFDVYGTSGGSYFQMLGDPIHRTSGLPSALEAAAVGGSMASKIQQITDPSIKVLGRFNSSMRALLVAEFTHASQSNAHAFYHEFECDLCRGEMLELVHGLTDSHVNDRIDILNLHMVLERIGPLTASE